MNSVASCLVFSFRRWLSTSGMFFYFVREMTLTKSHCRNMKFYFCCLCQSQGCIAKWVMAIKDSRKCRGLAACVTEALEHASPYQETLLVVQWKMIQMSPLDCQVGTGEVRWNCEPQASVAICVIQHLRSAPTLCPSLTDNPASQTGSANICRANSLSLETLGIMLCYYYLCV